MFKCADCGCSGSAPHSPRCPAYVQINHIENIAWKEPTPDPPVSRPPGIYPGVIDKVGVGVTPPSTRTLAQLRRAERVVGRTLRIYR